MLLLTVTIPTYSVLCSAINQGFVIEKTVNLHRLLCSLLGEDISKVIM